MVSNMHSQVKSFTQVKTRVLVEIDLLDTHQPDNVSCVLLVLPHCTCLKSFSRGVLSFEVGSLACFARISEVVGISIWFSEVDGGDSEDMSSFSFSFDFDFTDKVTFNYLIVGHALEF